MPPVMVVLDCSVRPKRLRNCLKPSIGMCGQGLPPFANMVAIEFITPSPGATGNSPAQAQWGDNGCHLLDPLYTAMKLTDPISVMATHSGMNDEVWPYAESVDFVYPGTEFTASDTIKIRWYDGGRRPSWKFKGVPSGKEMIQPASLLVGEKGYLLLPHWGDTEAVSRSRFRRG